MSFRLQAVLLEFRLQAVLPALPPESGTTNGTASEPLETRKLSDDRHPQAKVCNRSRRCHLFERQNWSHNLLRIVLPPTTVRSRETPISGRCDRTLTRRTTTVMSVTDRSVTARKVGGTVVDAVAKRAACGRRTRERSEFGEEIAAPKTRDFDDVPFGNGFEAHGMCRPL